MPDESVDLLIEARWIIPIRPARTVLRNHALVIDHGLVIDLLPTADARRNYRASQDILLADHALLPGLVNAHTHAAMTLLRGYADDLPLMRWLQNHIWPAESRWVSEEFVADGTLLAIAEMISGGTTCFSDMYFFPDCVAQTVVESGIRAQLAMPIFDAASAWGRDAADYISRGLRVRDDFKSNPRLSFAFGPHAPYSNSDATLARIAVLAEQLDAQVQIHLHETQGEILSSIDEHKCRPLERLERTGLLNHRLQAVHMTQVSEEDLALMRERAVKVVHCPSSNLKLASGRCPLEKLIGKRIPFAIGTDGAASNNSLDMFSEMRLCALLVKGGSGDPTVLDAYAALETATLGGAVALGLDNRIGSLECGKEADCIAVDLSGPSTSPVHDPVSQLVYAGNSSHVTDCWVAGNALLREGEFTPALGHDYGDIAERWRLHLAESLR